MYTEVKYTSKICFKLMELIYKTPDEDWQTYYNFMALKVPEEILDEEPLLVELAKKRKFHAGLLRMEPNTCYNWHMDTDRQVGLNMLVLDDGDSKCVFAAGYCGIVVPIRELKYKEFTYYVFNTQIPHTVYNFSEPRYLFTLEFCEEDKNLSYQDLCEDMLSLGDAA